MPKPIDASTSKIFNLRKQLYLLLSIAGPIVPWFWLLQDSSVLLSPTLFLQRAFENNVTAGLTSDWLISAIVFFYFASIELKRLRSDRRWVLLYVGLTFGVGLSCALPYFLYHREQLLERNAFRQQI